MKTMTVLRSAHCRAQTKRIRRDPQSGQLVKRGFSKEWLYHRREHPIHSFDELAELLGKLSADPYCAVVRGASIPGASIWTGSTKARWTTPPSIQRAR
jgi:hypothetical protein